MVNDEILFNATKGRAYASLHAKIEECKVTVMPGFPHKTPHERVAILVKSLKMVPLADKDPNRKEEKAAFGPPQPLSVENGEG